MSEFYEADCPEEYFAAMQRRIDDGSIWLLEGSAGRAAMGAIRDGHCTLGPRAFQDYYGNPIPGRDDVEPGTLGSVEYATRKQQEA